MDEVSASQGRQRFAELIDRVHESGEEVVITKHGRQHVKIVPLKDEAQPGSSRKRLFGLFKDGLTVAPGVDLSKPIIDWDEDAWLKKWDERLSETDGG